MPNLLGSWPAAQEGHGAVKAGQREAVRVGDASSLVVVNARLRGALGSLPTEAVL